MTVSKPLDLSALLDGPRTRQELGATTYTIQLAEQDGVIRRSGKRGAWTLWKLTPKGRRRAKKA